MNVSALLRGTDDGDEKDDANDQNRFTALRQFRISTCTAGPADPSCTQPASFSDIYTSPAGAFPGAPPRPARRTSTSAASTSPTPPRRT